jgi:hypothetical protein
MPRKWHHPPSFYCPISQQCMHDPVVLSDGHTYERHYIERWLEQHNTSPVSGLELPQRCVFPNHALRNAIEEYFREVFSAHRHAIRTATTSNQQHAGSSDPLLRTIDALVQCSLLMNADLSTECVLRRIMDEAKALVGAEVASVFLVDAERLELYSTVNSTKGELRIPITSGIAGHVATTGEPVVITDAYRDDRFNNIVDLKTGFKTRDMMCVPLKAKKGAVIGVVQLINKVSDAMTPTASRPLFRKSCCSSCMDGGTDGHIEEQSFTEDDRHFLEVFASQAATAVASSRLDPEQAGVRDKREGPQKHGGAATFAKPAAPQQTKAAASEVGTNPLVEIGKDGRAALAEPARPSLIPHVDASFDMDTKAADLLAGSLNSWQLDTLALADVTRNKPLSTLGVHLFSQLGLVEHFGLDQEKLSNFLVEIENGYDDANPYHNRSHAAAVMHAMYASLEHGGIARTCATALSEGDAAPDEHGKLEMMACLLAAAVHDYEHRGLTNDFLAKTCDARALLYNDNHVNENHHVAAAFAVLRRTECNFLSNLPAGEYRRLRSLIVDLVLGTDMANHGNLVKLFSEEFETSATSTPLSKKGAVLLLQITMKCADLGHLALDWDLHVEWVRRLESEFFVQGDKEKQIGLPVSFLMDREKPGASKSQVGFFDFVVLPLFRALARAAPGASDVLFNVTENYQRWRDFETSGNTGENASGKHVLRSQGSLTVSPAANEISTATVHFGEEISAPARKRSGRGRQRAAKWWASVRQRTPSFPLRV